MASLIYLEGIARRHKSEGIVGYQSECFGLRYNADGDKWWYRFGCLHRDNDCPAIESRSGKWESYEDGKLCISQRMPYKAWYDSGELHRVGGPAIEYIDGTKEWYLKGIQYTEVEYNRVHA